VANLLQIGEIVAKMSAAFPNWNPTKFTAQVYFDDLRDLDFELLEVAADKCRTESGRKFAPSTGEIRGAVADICRATSNTPSSYEAWKEVQKQIVENGGDFGNPVWSSPLVQKAVEAIGWRNLRMSEDHAADRMRFIQAYEQFEKRAMDKEMQLPAVRGYIEAHGGKLLEAPAKTIKQLAAKMEKTK